ncbi:MAG: hypothetical protein P8173_17405 [Gammaproteobacteria bacterium]|jgi:hypothetical protein
MDRINDVNGDGVVIAPSPALCKMRCDCKQFTPDIRAFEHLRPVAIVAK